MERKKYIFIALTCLTFIPSNGQIRNTIYQAFITSNMVIWENAIASFRPVTNDDKLELVNYLYGNIGYCLGRDQKVKAQTNLHKAEALLLQLEIQQYQMSMIYAYKAAFVGFKIGISPYKAPFLGKESMDFAKKSVALDGKNYFGYLQLGYITYYTPAILGGSKTDAIKYYLKALEIMEEDPSDLVNNWNYLNMLVTIINAYYEQGQYEIARKYCDKALKVEPEFDWVKNQLYPKVLKKLNNG